ncbi:MAG: molybdate ABC transporter substrate-binding protein [Beijerinckiaceae bacterium]|jgi:molybdate transport system substrate-binding protein
MSGVRGYNCFRAIALVTLTLGAAPALAQKSPSPGPIVFADASLKTALDAIAAAWTARYGTAPVITYASSTVLAKQIEAGAPADVFFSADLKGMDDLVREGFVDVHTRIKIIANELVLIAPADSKTNLKMFTGFDLAGALGSGRLAICAVETCPAGIYAKQALQTYRVWASVEQKLAPGEDERAAVALVATGVAPFGIVYATDAKAEPKVRVADVFATSTHNPIVYPIALAKSSKNPDAARFEAFTRSREATKVFLDQGFTVLK